MKLERKPFDVLNSLMMVAVLVCCIYPFYCLLTTSLTDPAKPKQWFFIFPAQISFKSYGEIFTNNQILGPLAVSLSRAISGTLITLLCSALFAYLVTQRLLPGRKFIYKLMVVTMYLNAGMIPWVVTMVNYGLKNSFLVYIVPTALSAFYVILIKTYIESIPAEIEESAKIDGAGFFRLFFTIILRISTPILGAVAMFSAVGQWNSWYDNLMLVQENSLRTLQLMLYQVMNNMRVVMNDPRSAAQASVMNRPSMLSVRSAIAMVSVLPVLMAYPFLQRSFTKGIMLGAVKG
jgi:ABC-type glycerol-3-phosphate transport system permease component